MQRLAPGQARPQVRLTRHVRQTRRFKLDPSKKVRAYSKHRIVVVFPAPLGPNLSRISGVTAVEVQGNHIPCQVVGSVEPLLGVLVASGVHQLLSREPSLEELFLAHYGQAPAADKDIPRAA